jgi:hypothetical protein
MKTRICSIATLFILLSILGWTKPVDSETAQKLAGNFLASHSGRSGQSQRSIRSIAPQSNQSLPRQVDLPHAFSITKGEYPAFHVFESGTEGFVIIAGDDLAWPILGYSTENSFNPTHLSPDLEAWLKSYQEQISAAITAGITQKPEIAKQWEALSTNATASIHTQGVAALTSTIWSQTPYYNDLCPFDSTEQERTVTGCVATAMAQIMKYWEYPAAGKGSSRYQHANYGVISADYGSTSYDWDNMPDSLSGSSSTTQKTAIATLMYHCGVSIQMDYGVYVSGMSDVSNILNSFKSYFDYATTISFMKKDQTSDSLWFQGLKYQLDQQQPVLYLGFNTDGKDGHAWVCDGYDDFDRFHMNWGWDGYGNGYFALSALQPVEGYDYTDDQMAVVGIKPSATQDDTTLDLYSPITISPDPILFGEPFTVRFNVRNQSPHSFAGVISPSVYDENNNFLFSLGEFYEEDLQAGYRYSTDMVLDNARSTRLIPGNYYTVILYKETGSDHWKKVMNSDYPNWVEFTIAPQPSDISLYAPITISNEATIKQNTPFDLSLNIINSGSNSFSGVIEMDFYNLNGDYCSDVGPFYHYDISNLQPNQHYPDNLTFTVPGVKIAQGEYFVALTHYAQDGDAWELSNPGAYSNPIKIWVQQGPDQYEPNDDEFVLITTTFTNDLASMITDFPTIHTEDDIDLFYIDLPAGYDYELDARVHDSSNSGNGKVYTTDVFWVLMTSDDFTESYDDIMDAPQRIHNGGYFAFGISGWGFDLGTYDLEINLSRLPMGSGIDPDNPRFYSIPLYRFYRSDNDSHFFTANEAEKNNILTNSPSDIWTLERVSQHVLSTQIANSNPVYRLFNTVSGGHFYTTSQQELEGILNTMGDTFKLEGVAFYALVAPVYGAMPVYRFYAPQTASHFFTISEAEKNQIIATIPTSRLQYEGIAWYAYP